jgi:hypothetical protein
VISVDTKKKETVGNFKNNGKEWHTGECPTEVDVYDFSNETANPYGVCDIAGNVA